MSPARPSGRAREAPSPGRAREAPSLLVRVGDGTEYRLRVKSATVPERPAGVQLDLAQAYIPVFLWRSLPVLVRQQQRISLVERFALEAAAELGSVTAAELAGLTALPERAIGPLLRRMLAVGALEGTGTDSYTPTQKAASILDEETVAVLAETVCDFAYFPASDELLVLTDATAPWRRRLFHRKLRPSLQMPLEEPLSGQPPSAIINRHLTANTAHWRPADLVQALAGAGEEPVGDLCPVFQASPVLCRFEEENQRYRVDLTFRSPAASKQGGQAGASPWTVKVDLSGIGGLVGYWRGLAGLAGEPEVLPLLWREVAGPGGALDAAELKKLVVEEAAAPRYVLSLTEEAVLKLRKRPVPLSNEVGIRLEDEQAAALIRIQLRPADDPAAALFALDEAAQLLDSDPAASYQGAIEIAARHSGLAPDSGLMAGPDQLRERMWWLRFYEAVYARRESDDFGYT
jgi:hypothetical protein